MALWPRCDIAKWVSISTQMAMARFPRHSAGWKDGSCVIVDSRASNVSSRRVFAGGVIECGFCGGVRRSCAAGGDGERSTARRCAPVKYTVHAAQHGRHKHRNVMVAWDEFASERRLLPTIPDEISEGGGWFAEYTHGGFPGDGGTQLVVQMLRGPDRGRGGHGPTFHFTVRTTHLRRGRAMRFSPGQDNALCGGNRIGAATIGVPVDRIGAGAGGEVCRCGLIGAL